MQGRKTIRLTFKLYNEDFLKICGEKIKYWNVRVKNNASDISKFLYNKQ
jgi:hypothetical protein